MTKKLGKNAQSSDLKGGDIFEYDDGERSDLLDSDFSETEALTNMATRD